MARRPYLCPAEPAGAAARTEIVLLGDQCGGRLEVPAGRRRPREEVDVDAADPTTAELDVAGAAPVVRRLLAPGAQRRDQRCRGDARLPLPEHPPLGHADP